MPPMRPSLLTRVLSAVGLRRRVCVGGDVHGNLYYAWSEPGDEPGDPPRERREVAPPSKTPHLFDARAVPPEWAAWLRRTRATPPSPEEVAANEARRERTRALAAVVDERAAAARAARAALEAADGADRGPAPLLDASFEPAAWTPGDKEK